MPADPDEIEARIEATRAELADTVDALAERLNPKRLARRGGQQVRGGVQGAVHRGLGYVGVGGANRGPGSLNWTRLAGALAVVVAGGLLLRRRRS